MRKILTALIATVVVVNVVVGQKPILIEPKVDEVTVYLSGAEVKFKENIALKRGDNIVMFKGLSPSLVINSVQVTLSENAEILSVSAHPEQYLPDEISPELKALKDSITMLEEQIGLITNQIDAYETEKKTLIQNQRIGGTQTGVSMTDLAKAADFFRERTLKINNSISDLNKNLRQLNEHVDEKRTEYKRELDEVNLTRYSVTLIINSKADQQVNAVLRHLVEDASWEASYDIIADELNKPVTLKYKAQVYNNTSIPWTDVKLQLSTGDISLDASRPYLTAWTLNYTSGANEGFLNNTAQNILRYDSGSNLTKVMEETTVGELNTSFEIPQRHSIKAGGQPNRIGLHEDTLPASFEYLTVPKVELSAFLIAKITGWEKLSLIDGLANVYFGNTFIGESKINTKLIGDTLELSLGRDNQIVVSRVKIEDKASTNSLAGKRTESFVYEIQLRNNRKESVTIKVQDQVPVSQEKDIIVDIADISGANLDVPSGRLQWIKNLSPGEATKYNVSFSVRYPKNKTVNIRKSRVVRTPRYRLN